MSAKLRWAIYTLFFTASCALMLYRIALVTFDDGKTPFFSANDRSRWLTIRSLGDFNTYQIDQAIDRKAGWHTIDMVRHKGSDGRQHFYSSKPPLLPTLMTYEYLAMKKISGVSVFDSTHEVARVLLITFNVIPIVVICILIALMAESYCESNWTKLFVVVCACFGTYLTTFATTLNNHIPAAFGAALGIYALSRIWIDDSKSYAIYFLAGLGAAWAAANELPALSFLAVAIAATLIKSPTRAMLGTVTGAAVIAAAFFLTNYNAHHDWIPAYANRSDGPVIAELDDRIAESLRSAVSDWTPARLQSVPDDLSDEVNAMNLKPEGWTGDLQFTSNTVILPGRTALPRDVTERWVIFDFDTDTKFAITKPSVGPLQLRQWSNWYEYSQQESYGNPGEPFPDSYWLEGHRKGIDLGEQSVGTYALHFLIGHHGVFSLTPIWILAFAAMFIVPIKRSPDQRDRAMSGIVMAIAMISFVVMGFYIARPEIDRNYGGICCTLRWLLWLNPLWLVCLIAAGDWLFSSKLMKVLAVILLLASFASSLYAFLNPWQHPWLYVQMVIRGLIEPY